MQLRWITRYLPILAVTLLFAYLAVANEIQYDSRVVGGNINFRLDDSTCENSSTVPCSILLNNSVTALSPGERVATHSNQSGVVGIGYMLESTGSEVGNSVCPSNTTCSIVLAIDFGGPLGDEITDISCAATTTSGDTMLVSCVPDTPVTP